MLYKGDKKETEIVNGIFVIKSNGEAVANKAIAGQSINDNVFQIFIQIPLDNSSYELTCY